MRIVAIPVTGADRGDVVGTVTEPARPADQARPYSHPFFWAPFVLMGNWK